MNSAFWSWLQELALNREQRSDEWARVIEYFYRIPPIGRSRSYIERLLLLMADPSAKRSFEDDKQIRLRQNSLSDVALSSLMFAASPKPDDTRHERSATPGASVKKLRPLVGKPLASFLEFLVEQGLPYESERKTLLLISKCVESFGYTLGRTTFQKAINGSSVLTGWKKGRLDANLAERQRNWKLPSMEECGALYFAACSLSDPSDISDTAYEEITERAIREATATGSPLSEISKLRSMTSNARTPEERSYVVQLLEGYLPDGGREVAAASYR